jgi:hypothetical protein
MLVDVVRAPLFSIWLWPMIPAAVVGFWPRPVAKADVKPATETKQQTA